MKKIIINVYGGLVESIIGTKDLADLEVLVLDSDIDGAEELATDEEIAEFRGNNEFAPIDFKGVFYKEE